MDPDPPKSAPRKVKFAPKEPRRKAPKLVPSKIEPAAEDDIVDVEAQEFLNRKVKEHLTKRGRKPENTAPVQVAFSHYAGSSSVRTFGRQGERSDVGRDAASDSKESVTNGMQNLVTSMSTVGKGEVGDDVARLTNDVTATKKKKKEYREPWDYKNSYYPTTLPWRKPYSGDPELLDKAEFEEALEYDENSMSSATELGLLDGDDTPRMLFFQFPSNLPTGKPATSAASKGKEIVSTSSRISTTTLKGKEKVGSSMNPVSGYPSKEGRSSLEELPDGYMGKMLVYKSGAVKLKLGDILYDVSPGSDCTFAQSVVAINTTDRNCCEVGELNKRAIVTPNIDSLLADNVIDLG